MKFRTTRLFINNWKGILSDLSARKTLEREIESMLVPEILKYLPPSMQFSVGHDDISDWVESLDAEATVLSAHTSKTNELVGLIILAENPEPSAIRTTHLGYFLGKKHWGQGYATEIISALVSEFGDDLELRLVAGVDSANLASARVLEKSGFVKLHEQSTDSRAFFELLIF